MSTTFLCHCGGTTSVKDSRAAAAKSVRRRRECDTCGNRVTTYEMEFEGAVGIIDRAEAIGRKAKTLLEAASDILAEVESLQELTEAHKLIHKARYAGVLREQ